MSRGDRAANERRERLCQDGIAAVEMFSAGEPPAALLTGDATKDAELMEGVILYAHLLEAILNMPEHGNIDPRETRRASKVSATLWRTAGERPRT